MQAPLGGEDLAAVLANVGEAIIVRDVAGHLVYANPAAAAALGFADPEELLAAGGGGVLAGYGVFGEDGMPFPLDRLPGRRALAGEDEPTVTVRFRVRATGEERWSEVRARPIRDEEGRVRFAVSVWRDVTDRRRA